MTNLLYYVVGDVNPPSFDELEYVAVSEHPNDVVPISNGDYNQPWNSFHYENFVLGKTRCTWFKQYYLCQDNEE